MSLELLIYAIVGGLIGAFLPRHPFIDRNMRDLLNSLPWWLVNREQRERRAGRYVCILFGISPQEEFVPRFLINADLVITSKRLSRALYLLRFRYVKELHAYQGGLIPDVYFRPMF